jgi:hypothetical protein
MTTDRNVKDSPFSLLRYAVRTEAGEILIKTPLDYLDHAYELIKWRVDDLEGADHTGASEEIENLEKTLDLLNDLAVGNKWVLSKQNTKKKI